MSNNKLRDRCAETIVSTFTAIVGASVQLAGGLVEPAVSQTFKSAYKTIAGESVRGIPVSFSGGLNWESGYATFDHDSNSLTIESISESSAGGTAVSISAGSNVIVTILADIPFANRFTLRPRGFADDIIAREAYADLTAQGGGKLVLEPGEFVCTGTCPMYPGIWTEGSGTGVTNVIVDAGLPAFALFSFDSSVTGHTSNQQGWGMSRLSVSGNDAHIGTQFLDSKVGAWAMQQTKLDGVDISGFGIGDLTAQAPLINIGDPQGCYIHECIIKDIGNRSVIKASANGLSKTGFSLWTNDIAKHQGTGVELIGLEVPRVTFNTLEVDSATGYGLKLTDCNSSNVSINQFNGLKGTSLAVLGTSTSNQLLGNIGAGSGEASTVGVRIASTVVDTSLLAGAFKGFANDLDNNSASTYAASFGTTSGIIHLPEPTPAQIPTTTNREPLFSSLGLIETVSDWVTCIDCMFSSVKTADSTSPRLALGYGSNTYQRESYQDGGRFLTASGTSLAANSSSDGILISQGGGHDSLAYYTGTIRLTRGAGNEWYYVVHSQYGFDTQFTISGSVVLQGDLSRMRFETGSAQAFENGNVTFRMS